MQPKSLILITVDCLRADHVGFLGHRQPTTPFLDSIAEESVVLENAIAAGSPTYYAMPPLLASRYPLALGRDVLGIAPDETTLASALQESGFATAAFSAANPYISPRFGYDRGFAEFRDFLEGSDASATFRHSGGMRRQANELVRKAAHSISSVGAMYDELYFRYCQKVAAKRSLSLDSQRAYPSAEVLVDHALRWLNTHSQERFFIWLHFMDAHGPYYPKTEALEMMGGKEITPTEAVYLNSYWNRSDLSPERLRTKMPDVLRLYDAGVRWVDEQIRRLAASLRELRLWDICALAVTADHGEEFLDHGGRYHLPRKVTEELIHVPLLLRVPGHSRGFRVAEPYSVIDVAPTLLDIMGLPSPAEFRGRSRWEQLRKQKFQDYPVVTECVHECTNPFSPHNRFGPRLLAVRLQQYKMVLDFSAGSDSLYDLGHDPGEHKPLPLNEAWDMRRKLLKIAQKHVVESSQSRDFDRRIGSQVREFRLELARPATCSQN